MNAHSTRQKEDAYPASGDFFWLSTSDARHDLPDAVSDAVRIPKAGLSALPANTAVFASFSTVHIGSAVKDLRSDLNKGQYLVAITEQPLSPAWQIRLIELGADDVAAMDDTSLNMAKARAARQIQRQNKLEMEIGVNSSSEQKR